MAKRDYYEVLGVSKNASEADLKKAYRRLAMKHHPDRNQDNPSQAEARFKEAKEAYDVLSDSNLRARYDQFGHDGIEGMPGGFASEAGFEDIFDGIFSDIFGSRRRARQAQASNLRISLTLDLEEAVNGAERQVSVPRMVVCKTCDGNGAKPGTRPTRCSHCGGSGQVRMQQLGFTLSQTCPSCRGTGSVVRDPCGDCNGQGRVQETTKLSVQIPAGIDDGNQIRLSGKGEEGPQGMQPGDLFVEIRIRKHSIFTRDGDDLYCEVPVSFAVAALGGTEEIPTLDGRANLKIRPETQTGKMMRLRGKGVRNVRSGEPGDLFCRLIVETPVNLDSRQRELLAEFDTLVKRGGETHTPGVFSWTRRIKSFWEKLAA